MKKHASIFVAALATILSASLMAAPPAPELPTGACAGIIKKSTLAAFTPTDLQALSPEGIGAPVISAYLDFDNSLFYLSATREFAADADSTADDWTSSDLVVLADGEPFTIAVSTTHAFALQLDGSFTFEGETEDVSALLIPANSGTTFFVQLAGSPETGVCQKI